MYKKVKVSHVRACSYLSGDFTAKSVSCYINAFVTKNKLEDRIVRTKHRFWSMSYAFVIYFSSLMILLRPLLLESCVISAMGRQSALYIKQQPWGGSKMKPMRKCQKQQLIKWPLEAGYKSESMHIRLHIKMLHITAEISMFTAWYKKTVWAYTAHSWSMTTELV